MKKNRKLKIGITRRSFLPFLGAGFFLPFLGSAKAVGLVGEESEYQTLITKDGRAVKVKKSAIEKSKVIDKNLSNKSLLKWLTKNDKDI